MAKCAVAQRLYVLRLMSLLSLIGCSTPAQVSQYPNQEQMAGKTKAAVLACAGTPIREQTRNGVTLLQYYREAPILEESAALGKGSFSTIRHGCWATLVLSDDRVTDIHYRFAPSTFDASNDCEAIFNSCVR